MVKRTSNHAKCMYRIIHLWQTNQLLCINNLCTKLFARDSVRIVFCRKKTVCFKYFPRLHVHNNNALPLFSSLCVQMCIIKTSNGFILNPNKEIQSDSRVEILINSRLTSLFMSKGNGFYDIGLTHNLTAVVRFGQLAYQTTLVE